MKKRKNYGLRPIDLQELALKIHVSESLMYFELEGAIKLRQELLSRIDATMEFHSKDTEWTHYWRERLEKEISHYKKQLEEIYKPDLGCPTYRMPLAAPTSAPNSRKGGIFRVKSKFRLTLFPSVRRFST
jgi:hypothetical protein